MILFLYGPDDYRREEQKRYYIREFRKKHTGLAVDLFDLLEEQSPVRLDEFVRGQSLFTTHKLGIIENAFQNEDYDIRVLLEHVRKMGPQTTILLSEGGIPGKEWEFLLEKPSHAEHFEHLIGAEWEAFVGNIAKNFHMSLAADARLFLTDVYRGNPWALVTELQKMSFFGKETVCSEDLSHLDLEIAPDFWEMMNGLKRGSQKTRLAALERMFAHREPVARMFNTIAYQMPEKLAAFARYDVAIKLGKMGHEEALLDVIL